MTWPQLLKRTLTCPNCGTQSEIETIHKPHQRVYNDRNRIYKSITWAECPRCAHEWQVQDDARRTSITDSCS